MTALKPKLDGVGVGMDVPNMLAEAGVIGVWRYDVKLGLVSGDEAMAQSYRLDPALLHDGLDPQKFREAIHPVDLADAVQALNHSIQYATDYRARYRLRSATGEWKMVSANGRIHRDKSGAVSHVAGVNLVAEDDGDTDPHNRMALLAAELLQLGRTIEDPYAQDLSYALLQHVSLSIAAKI